MNTPELSNVARVLISRMESHPEDFDHDGRFSNLQDSLYHLLGIHTSNPYGGPGRLAFLSDTDRAALAEAWRALNYTKFEKQIMDTLFQSDAEREEEKKKLIYPQAGIQTLNKQAQLAALQTQMLAQSTGTIGPQPGGLYGLANNTASTGLLGSIGSALGITK